MQRKSLQSHIFGSGARKVQEQCIWVREGYKYFLKKRASAGYGNEVYKSK